MKQQSADELSRLRTDGVKTTHLNDDIPVCNVENRKVANDE